MSEWLRNFCPRPIRQRVVRRAVYKYVFSTRRAAGGLVICFLFFSNDVTPVVPAQQEGPSTRLHAAPHRSSPRQPSQHPHCTITAAAPPAHRASSTHEAAPQLAREPSSTLSASPAPQRPSRTHCSTAPGSTTPNCSRNVVRVKIPAIGARADGMRVGLGLRARDFDRVCDGSPESDE